MYTVGMATKKTSTKKAPVSKKPAAKRTKTKVTKANASAANSLKNAFKLQRDRGDFMTFRVNRETVYWIVLGAVVILFAMWILQLQADIQALYDEIDASSAMYDTLEVTEAEASKN
jgi:hypothetical protein